MPKVYVEWRGLDSLEHAMREMGTSGAELAGQALYQEAQIIFAQSQMEVPFEYGTLQASGMLNTPDVLPNYVEITMGYGGPAAPYALIVHERETAPSGRPIRYTKPGTHHHYLSGPVEWRLAQMPEAIAKRIQRQLDMWARRGL